MPPRYSRTVKGYGQGQGKVRPNSSRPDTKGLIHAYPEQRAEVPYSGEWKQDNLNSSYGIAVSDNGPRMSRCTTRNELLNYGRVPLNSDIVSDRTRRLPSVHEDSYGGGFRLSSQQVDIPQRRNELHNVGRVPLMNSDTVAGGARCLPSDDEASYGGGFRLKNEQRVINSEDPIKNGTHANGDLKLGTQLPHQVNRSAHVGAEKEDAPGDYDLRCGVADPPFGNLYGSGKNLGLNELKNYGRVPLNSDFVSDRALRLPSDHEDSFGGGFRPRNEQRVGKAQVPMKNTAPQLSVHSKGLASKQISSRQVNLSVGIAGQKKKRLF